MGNGMKRPQAPCLRCEDRTIEDPETGARDCHDRCAKFRKYKQDLSEYKEKLRAEIGADRTAACRPWLDPRKQAAAKRREKNGNH